MGRRASRVEVAAGTCGFAAPVAPDLLRVAWAMVAWMWAWRRVEEWTLLCSGPGSALDSCWLLEEWQGG